MWQLDNRTPYAAERAFVRDRHGAEVLLVAVKATFAIRADGVVRLAEEQEPVVRTAEWAGEPGRSSLLRESELVPPKRATDVLLLGTAHAPHGERAIAAEVVLRVGPVHKRVVVVGDRVWRDAVSEPWMSEPEPFETMPLAWERAYGGVDADESGAEEAFVENPIGRGFARSATRVVGRRVPNLEDPRDLIRSWRHRPRPMGLGPIPRHWSPRRELAGTHDDAWRTGRMPLVPLDFDDRFHHTAPVDQRSEAPLAGGEPVELSHVTPSGKLRFELPRVAVVLRTRVRGGVVRHVPTLETVILEPDAGKLVLVLVSALPCQDTLYGMRRTRVSSVRA